MLFFLFSGASVFDLIGLSVIAPYVALIAGESAVESSFEKLLVFFGFALDRGSLLIVISLLLLGVFIVKSIASMWINWVIIDFSLKQQLKLRSFLMKAYQMLPYVDHVYRNSSDNIYHIQQLTNQYSMQVLIPLLRTLSDGIVVILIVGFLAWQNTSALILLMGLLSVMVLGYERIFRIKIRAYGEEANKSSIKMVKSIQESAAGLKDIKILGKEKYFYDMFYSGASDNAFYIKKSQLFSSMPRYILELFMVIFVVSTVLVAILTDKNLEALASTLAVFGVASLRLLPAANLFSNSLVQLQYGRDAVSRLRADVKVLDNKEKWFFQSESDDTNVSSFQKFSLDRVSFTHKKSVKKILDQISFEILSGEAVGIVGLSGSGKTTLVDLMLGLFKPQDGNIYYNGKALDTALSEWRSQVAYLPQKTFLTDDTIRNNIAFGVCEDEVDDELLRSAIIKSQLAELISQLPDGIDTLLGENGERLSGGQRQRVALARAFYHKRRVLIMDESTSALDTQTEREVIREIKNLKGKMTIIVIAHRLKTLEFCDRIYELKNGKIMNYG